MEIQDISIIFRSQDIIDIVICLNPIKEFKCEEIENDPTEPSIPCNGTTIEITNPIKDFYIKAEEEAIAIGATFNIIINTQVAPAEPIEEIEGVIASEAYSLADSTVMITNNQAGQLLEIKKLEFNEEYSGDGFTLYLIDGAGSGGIRLLETKCDENGLACTDSSALEAIENDQTIPEAAKSCTIITVDSAGNEAAPINCYDVSDASNNEQIVSTAAAPALPAAKSNLESELLRNEFRSMDDGDIEKKVTINFSESFMVNLWLMLSLFVLVNVGVCYCYKSQPLIKSGNLQKSVYVEDDDV